MVVLFTVFQILPEWATWTFFIAGIVSGITTIQTLDRDAKKKIVYVCCLILVGGIMSLWAIPDTLEGIGIIVMTLPVWTCALFGVERRSGYWGYSAPVGSGIDWDEQRKAEFQAQMDRQAEQAEKNET